MTKQEESFCFWKNINIENDLEICTYEYKKKNTNIMETTLWIRHKKTNGKLQVILEPMVVKWPKIYPHGNYIGNDHNDNEKEKKNRIFDARELENALYSFRLQPEKFNDENVNDLIGIECLEWLKKLEEWFAEKAYENPNVWTKEKNDITYKLDEEYQDDPLQPELFEKRKRRTFVKGMATKIQPQKDKETDEILKNKCMKISLTQKVYTIYEPREYKKILEQNHVIFDEEEKKIGVVSHNDNDDDYLENNNNNKYYKHIIPLYDFKGKLISQMYANIQHNDLIAVCLSFKKRDVPNYGLSYKIQWIQVIKQNKKEKMVNFFHHALPINWGDIGIGEDYHHSNNKKTLLLENNIDEEDNINED